MTRRMTRMSPSDMIYLPLHRRTVHRFSLHCDCGAVDRHFPLLLFEGNTAFADLISMRGVLSLQARAG